MACVVSFSVRPASAFVFTTVLARVPVVVTLKPVPVYTSPTGAFCKVSPTTVSAAVPTTS
ncbi:hypothetical protein D3C85_1075460 [compost metagenome]